MSKSTKPVIEFGSNRKEILVPAPSTALATVQAEPEGVRVTVTARDGMLTVSQTRQLAQFLSEAAEEADRLEWADVDSESLDMVEKS